MAGLLSVSYTHLDVYKRQVQGINEETPASCTRTVKKYTDGGWLTISRTEGYKTPLARTTPVSYTHLDVYKRQE